MRNGSNEVTSLEYKLLSLIKREARNIGVNTEHELSSKFKIQDGNRFLPSSVYFLGAELNSEEIAKLKTESKEYNSNGVGLNDGCANNIL